MNLYPKLIYSYYSRVLATSDVHCTAFIIVGDTTLFDFFLTQMVASVSVSQTARLQVKNIEKRILFCGFIQLVLRGGMINQGGVKKQLCTPS